MHILTDKISKYLFIVALVIFALFSACNERTGESDSNILFLTGSYSPETKAGIQLLELDPELLTVKKITESRAGANPSFLAYYPDKGIIYAVNEISEKDSLTGGAVSSLRINREKNSIQYLNETRVRGEAPCHISLSEKNACLYVSNYLGGSLSVINLDSDAVPVGESFSVAYSGGESVSHVHMAVPVLDQDKLLVSDLGLDRLLEYDISEGSVSTDKARVIPAPPGSGPRHFVFDSAGSILYVAYELSSEIGVFERTEEGYTPVGRYSTLPQSYNGENSCSHIELSPDRSYLYVGNRGHNSIAVFKLTVPGSPELLTTVGCEGDWPRNFSVSPGGKFLIVANQRSDNISVFSLGPDDGIPSYTGLSYEIDSPSCILFPDK